MHTYIHGYIHSYIYVHVKLCADFKLLSKHEKKFIYIYVHFLFIYPFIHTYKEIYVHVEKTVLSNWNEH